MKVPITFQPVMIVTKWPLLCQCGNRAIFLFVDLNPELFVIGDNREVLESKHLCQSCFNGKLDDFIAKDD